MRRLLTFVLVGAAVALGTASSAGAYVYWQSYDSGNSRVGRVGLDRTNPNGSFITGGYFSAGVASDGQFLYWGNSGSSPAQGHIGRANVDGTGVDQNALSSGTYCGTFAVATHASLLYWMYSTCSPGNYGIARTGSGGTIVSVGYGACGIAVDDTYLYWSEGHYIGRSLLNGGSQNHTWLDVGSTDQPCGLAVNASHIFWTVQQRSGAAGTTIGRATIDGNPASVQSDFMTGALFLNGTSVPSGVAVDDKFIYWANQGVVGSIGRASLDGSGFDPNFETGVFFPGAVAVDSLGPAQAPAGALPNFNYPFGPPRLEGVSISNGSFSAGSGSTSGGGRTAKAKVPVGTVFSFTLDQAATVSISFELKNGGRKSKGKCRKPTKKLAKKRSCALAVAKIGRDAHAGLNKVPFTGRIKGKAFKPGKYQAVFVAKSSGGASKSARVSFRIVKR